MEYEQTFPVFPKDFGWGTATAAYQIEGAYNENGKGMSIWDTFSHIPGKIHNNDNGDVACDHYHRVEEDVQLLKKLGVKYYRFSISWTRIFPSGKPPLNQAGIDYYKREIELLLQANIIPFVTLYHWDLPQGLEDEGGWLSNKIIQYFADYAKTCFENFGDKVKHWITFNEPKVVTTFGYGYGSFPPGRSSDRSISSEGDSSTEPYITTHHVLLAHAQAVKIYNDMFKATQKGVIGITLNSKWAEPMTDSKEDKEASEAYMQFSIGWFFNPLYTGDYPEIMIKRLGDRLPKFNDDDKKILIRSFDFLGVNHYSTSYCYPDTGDKLFFNDSGAKTTFERNGEKIGVMSDCDWLYAVPWGIRKLLVWIQERYGKNIPIWITENGTTVPGENEKPLSDALNDTFRVSFLNEYLKEVLKAINDHGVNVKGYFVWSFMDNFEWTDGYDKRFGIYYVDFKDKQKRYEKKSANYFRELISHNTKYYSNI